MKQNIAVGLKVDESDHSIEIQVLDVNMTVGGRQEVLTATIWVTLTSDLSYGGSYTGDDYDILYDQLVEEGTIPDVSRKEALEGYGRTLLYLKGEKWVGAEQ